MNIHPLTGSIGAVVTGIDLKTMDEATFQAVEQAFADHLVLCFRDQSLDPSDMEALTARFGGPGDTPYLTGMEDHPDVVPIVKEAKETSPVTFGAGWHTDFTFQARPPSRTLLYAIDVPDTGGDTLYANLHAAWSALSRGMQDVLLPLRAVHSSVRSYGPQATLRDHLEHMTINNDTREPDTMLHPVVRQHPVTGKPALWVNPTYTITLENMTPEECQPLLAYLNSHAVNPSWCCRVTWEPGTLTMWDNRATQHCATSDYRGHRREMWRTTVAGENPIAFTPN